MMKIKHKEKSTYIHGVKLRDSETSLFGLFRQERFTRAIWPLLLKERWMHHQFATRTCSSRVDEHGMVRVREVRQAQSIPGGQIHLVAPRSKLVALHIVLAELPEAPLEVPNLHCSSTVAVGIVNCPFVEDALQTTHLLFPESLPPPPELRFLSDPAPTTRRPLLPLVPRPPASISAAPVGGAISKFLGSLVLASAAASASSVAGGTSRCPLPSPPSSYRVGRGGRGFITAVVGVCSVTSAVEDPRVGLDEGGEV